MYRPKWMRWRVGFVSLFRTWHLSSVGASMQWQRVHLFWILVQIIHHHTLSFSNMHTIAHTQSLIHTQSLSQSHTHTNLSLSHSLTHTHTELLKGKVNPHKDYSTHTKSTYIKLARIRKKRQYKCCGWREDSRQKTRVSLTKEGLQEKGVYIYLGEKDNVRRS